MPSAKRGARQAVQAAPSNQAVIGIRYRERDSEIVVGDVNILLTCSFEQLLSNVQQHLKFYMITLNYYTEDERLVPITCQADLDAFRNAYDLSYYNRLDLEVLDRS